MARFVPRERKHRKLARTSVPTNTQDTNKAEIQPEAHQAEREVRRTALRAQIQDAAATGAAKSSKKRKRLEKYIDTKLKKDENADLLRKLESQQVDTSLLQSSKKLGRITESKRERLQRALRERQAGINDGEAILFERREDGEYSTEEDAVLPQPARQASALSAFGSGLKRPLDCEEDGGPAIRKRKRRREHEQKVVVTEDVYSAADEAGESDESDEWQGFSSEDQDTPESSVDSESSDDERKPRISAFKAWADSQRNAALDFKPSVNAENVKESTNKVTTDFKPRSPSPDPVATELTSTGVAIDKPSTTVNVPRDESIQTARLELPVVQEEQKIMENVHHHPVVVVCGATGSGKTTQVPQMLFENGYASDGYMIGVTQPRRVAATSVASRVAHELGSYGKVVAHQVRYDSSMKSGTAIKFMTDGILLREIQQDFVLSKYRAIVLDEAHERSVNTDLLIGMLSRIVPLRAELAKEQPGRHKSLKLIIMSATLSQSVDSFLKNERLWSRSGGIPPIVEAEGRQYPVTVHFARRTRKDFLTEVIEKVSKGHRKLPPGGILVFLTGQQEIWTVAKKLGEKLGGGRTVSTSSTANGRRSGDVDDYDDEDEDGTGMRDDDFLEGEDDLEDSDTDAGQLDDDDFEINDFEPRAPAPRSGSRAPLKPHILPLYAALPANQQLRVFQPALDGYRSIVLATNVAETSLTIPGIRYVFDSGRVKEKRYDTSTGVQTFEVDWTSKASAEQRKGRAGRTGPGHVWRLYSSNVYEQFFADETVPEILRTPLESTVLQLKAMEIENVVNFPFPTSPELHQLKTAERLLINMGAIENKVGSVTKIGKDVLRFPVSPRFGKMLLLAQVNNVVPHAIAIVAALAVGDLFIPEMQSVSHGLDNDEDEDEDSDSNTRAQARVENAAAKMASEQRHQAYTRAQAQLARWDDRSDAVKLLMAVAIHADADGSGPLGTGTSARCQQFSLREKGMEEVQLLRKQLHNIIGVKFTSKLSVLSEKDINTLKQVTGSGFVDQVAIRADKVQDGVVGRKPRRAIEVAYRTLFASSDANTVGDADASPHESEIMHNVYIHPSSVLARLSVAEMPEYLVYSHLSRAAPSVTSGTTKRTRLHPLTTITNRALAALAEGTPLLQIGRPVGKIEDLPRNEHGKQRRQCWVSLGLKAPESTTREWPVGAWKVVQRREKDWEIEEVLAR